MPGLNFRHGVNTATPGVTPDDNLYGNVALAGIANDGALLASAEDRFNADGQPTRVSLYRLPAGSPTWQNGGALPFSAANGGVSGIVTYAPRPGGGMLWAMPAECPGNQQPSGPVFTASYPGPAAQPLPTQPQQSPTQTGNVDPAAPLEWQPITNPTGFQPRLVTTNILAIAPSDGNTAYACAQPNLNPPATQPLAWVTHNGGASWQRVSSLAGSLVYQFATSGSATYVLRDMQPLATNATAELQASSDGMVTWRAIDSGIRSGTTSVGQFWLNPVNGELLATNAAPSANGGITANGSSAFIWRSNDGGAHWRDLQAPHFGLTTVLVQPPQPNHTWGICVSDFTASPGAGASNSLYCGDDSGQDWHDMTALDTGSIATIPTYTTFTSDGAILALNAATTSSGTMTHNVFRLPAGAIRWQSLGPTPEYSLRYAPATDGDGILWSVPMNGVLTDAQGRIFRVAAP